MPVYTDVPPFDALPLDGAAIADLRSDHAGECGAVMIYAGILAISQDPGVRTFARQHLRTEVRHRRFFDRWLPARHRSRLLPVWNAAGWGLGAFAALLGPRTVYRTIAAVETFVEKHYLRQIEPMRRSHGLSALADRLQAFCDDEVHHREDAARRVAAPEGALARAWIRIVAAGSAAGVAAARRL